MTVASRARQVWTIAKLELRRVFFSKRSFWIYLLALFPAFMFFVYGVNIKFDQSRWVGRETDAVLLEAVRQGDTDEEVLRRLGEPLNDHTYTWRRGDVERVNRTMRYFDGKNLWYFHFESGILQRKRTEPLIDLNEDRRVFAGVFQYFYLRLAIFFGCLGIFMNLFRGEMLDKTLHYWFLAPARREVLLLGKYLAGLIAAVLIFSTASMLCFGIMLWPQDAVQVSTFWQNQGPSHLFWYGVAAALGCVGYGSVFLAAGLLLRNPVVPAIVILFWEGISGMLPSVLQKLSVLHYVQSLCPMPAPTDPGAPLLIRLLMAPAEPPSAAAAVLGLLGLTALVLWVAAGAVRRLEIDYGTDG